MKVKVTQLCSTLCDPMDDTVHGILQARILEWVAFPFIGVNKHKIRHEWQYHHSVAQPTIAGLFPEHSITPEGNPRPNLLPIPHPRLIHSPSLWICRLWTFHTSGITQHVAFCLWLLSLSLLCSRVPWCQYFTPSHGWMTFHYIAAVQALGCVRLFSSPWAAACQASLSFTVSRSLLKIISTELVMPSNHLILCQPLLLLCAYAIFSLSVYLLVDIWAVSTLSLPW